MMITMYKMLCFYDKFHFNIQYVCGLQISKIVQWHVILI